MMRARATLPIILALALAAPGWTGDEVKLNSEESKTLYAIGLNIATGLGIYELDEKDLVYVMAGIEDGVLGADRRIDLDQYQEKIAALMTERRKRSSRNEEEKSRAFLEKWAKEEGATRTESGLIFFELKPGDGASPGPDDYLKARWTATLRTGAVVGGTLSDSDPPLRTTLDTLVECWREAVPRMRVGGKYRLVCPAELAFGDRGWPPQIPPGAAVLYEIELIATGPQGDAVGRQPRPDGSE